MKFWAVLSSGAAGKKTELFGVVFSTFVGKKKLSSFKKHFSIRTGKLNSIKAKEILKNLESMLSIQK